MSRSEPSCAPCDRVMDAFRASEVDAADAALAAALDHLEEAQCAPVIALLLERGRAAGYEGLIERYDRLPPEVRRIIEQSGPAMDEAIQRAFRNGQNEARTGALILIERRRTMRLAYLASDGLIDRSTVVRQQAALSLKSLAAEFASRAPEATEIEARRALVDALRTALDRFHAHHRTEIIEAAMCFVDDLGPDLFESRNGRRGMLTHAMLEVFGQSRSAALAPFAYEALRHNELRNGIVRSIETRQDSEFFAGMIRHRWRSRIGGTRKALKGVQRLAWLERGIAPLLALPEALHGPGVAFVSELGLPDEALLELLRGVLDQDAPQAVREAAWSLVARPTPEARGLLRLVAESPHGDAARVARFELSRRGRSTAPVAVRRRLESDGEWSSFLRRFGLEATFASFWAAAERLERTACKLEASQLARRIPDFAPELRKRLCGSFVEDRLQAHRLVAALGLHGLFENELFAQADDPDERVRVAALAAAGRMGGATARRISERALEDRSPLVRQAAVEALAVAAGDRAATMLEARCEDESPSVRAAAIRVLLMRRAPQAAQALLKTLRHPNAEHRMAALSVVERLRLSVLEAHVAIIAGRDPDPRVRSRAARIMQSFGRAATQEKPAVAAVG